MEYVIIEVPDKNDSVSRIVLGGKQYQLRFTWNDTGGFWTFGVSDALGSPITIGMKIIPGFPINVFYGAADLPDGVFCAVTRLSRIGRDDFKNGKAGFVFIPAT